MKIASIGHAYFPHKLQYQADSCSDLGMNYYYFVLNKNEIELSTSRYQVVQVPTNRILRILYYFYWFFKNKFDVVEVYDTGLLTLYYTLIGRVFGVKVIIFLIGMELLPTERGEVRADLRRKLKRIGLYLSLRISKAIIYKELHMKPFLVKWKVFGKSHHLHNSVPICNEEFQEKDIEVIYCNTIRKMRYPLLFLEAVNKLKKEGVVFNCVMMGYHSLEGNIDVPDIEAEKQALDYILKNDLGDKVEILPFKKSSREYLKRSKIFILPSDVIYANYSLLEAMSYYSVPIVTRGNGAENIITNSIDGYICDFNSDEIADTVKQLLSDPELFKGVSLQARSKIESSFSIDAWARKLLSIYNEI